MMAGVMGFSLALSLGGLAGMHFWLLCTNNSTLEMQGRREFNVFD